MQDAHNQDAMLGRAVENHMAHRADHSIAQPNMARVATVVREMRQPLERLMKLQDVFVGAGKAPFL